MHRIDTKVECNFITLLGSKELHVTRGVATAYVQECIGKEEHRYLTLNSRRKAGKRKGASVISLSTVISLHRWCALYGNEIG